ncbi:hypothetical protein ADEAN_000622000 [Angomonas deanei]|uniref:Uncharacterized protein n=1 Tax=Angomonas deanei TaxID=59799 RepID=A0A7G2CGV2_9TRYP|nr:hypothetical protein ADEAN_000622000 [Angomonas deanei]
MTQLPEQKPLGYTLTEREEICFALATDVCEGSAHYVSAVRDRMGGDGYLRVVYGIEAEQASVERVTCASLLGTSEPLYHLLTQQSTTPTAAPCWLTVRLEDGCILHHCLFTIDADHQEPQQFVGTVVVEGGTAPVVPAPTPDDVLPLPPLPHLKGFNSPSPANPPPLSRRREPSTSAPADWVSTPKRETSRRPDSARRRSSAYRDELWERADSAMSHGGLVYR